ncbi:MAG: MFS transporter [Deltaproteobacteria bacterium]|nr:MFS transporter [Deltaproteobacteria bacterium]
MTDRPSAPASTAGAREATPSGAAALASRGSVPIVLLVIFIDLLGFGVVLPMLPYLTAQYEVPAWMTSTFGALHMSRGTNAVIVGLLSFNFNLFSFLASPLWGRLSDNVGRKPVLAFSLFGYSLAWTLFAFAPTLGWLLMARVLAGMAAANVSTAHAYIADVYPPEKRAKGMGLVGAAFGLGFTLGPAVGAGFMALGDRLSPSPDGLHHSHLALHLPVYVTMALSTIACLLAVFVLPESLPKELRGRKESHEVGLGLGRLLVAIRRPLLGPLLVSFFTVTFGFAVLESMFSEFNRAVLELPPNTNALVFSIIGLTIVIVQGGLIGRLTKAFGPWKVLFTGLLLEGLMLVNYGMVTGMTVLITFSVIGAFGHSLCNPSILALISQQAADDERGGTMGLAGASSALGRICGPILGSVAWAWGGAAAAFASGGVVVLLALPLLMIAHKSHATADTAQAVA